MTLYIFFQVKFNILFIVFLKINFFLKIILRAVIFKNYFSIISIGYNVYIISFCIIRFKARDTCRDI